jgi:hypothetical protein
MRQPDPEIQPGIYREVDDGEISEEEANMDIDLLDLSDSAVQPAPKIPATVPAEDTTPSVRVAVDRAVDILRELRGDG